MTVDVYYFIIDWGFEIVTMGMMGSLILYIF